MEACLGLCLFLAASFWSVKGTGSACQDIDHDACVAMDTRNPKMCSDQILANTACPAFCRKCPVTCYNCNSTTSDVSHCNTVTCAKGEVSTFFSITYSICVLKTMSGTGSAELNSMTCGAQTICSLGRKRNQQYSDALGLQSRDKSLNLKCCDSDLCNTPSPPAPTKKSTVTTQQTTMTSSTTTTTTTKTTTPPPTTTSTPIPTISQTPATQKSTMQQTSVCKRDIIIVLDESSLMTPFLGAIKSVLKDVISQLDIGPDSTRVALGTFSRSGTKRWNLDSHLDKPSLLSAIDHISSQSRAFGTGTGNNLVAIELALYSFSQGNRPAIPDDVIFITEGHSPHWFSQNKENAAIQSLHQKSSNVIAIALRGANQNEMHHISTDNNHYLYIEDFAHYGHQNVVSNILNLICK